jgi:hypothetical protein
MPTKNRTLGKVLATSNSNIYTVPARWNAAVTSIIVANTTSSSTQVSIEWYDSFNTTWYYIMKDTVLVPNSVLQIEEPLYLIATDQIRGLASVDSSVTVTIKLFEDFATAL